MDGIRSLEPSTKYDYLLESFETTPVVPLNHKLKLKPYFALMSVQVLEDNFIIQMRCDHKKYPEDCKKFKLNVDCFERYLMGTEVQTYVSESNIPEIHYDLFLCCNSFPYKEFNNESYPLDVCPFTLRGEVNIKSDFILLTFRENKMIVLMKYRDFGRVAITFTKTNSTEMNLTNVDRNGLSFAKKGVVLHLIDGTFKHIIQHDTENGSDNHNNNVKMIIICSLIVKALMKSY